MRTYSKKRIGQVVSIRVRPEDCLSILDVLDQLGIEYKHGRRSFSQCVSIGLASLIQTARTLKIIPENPGYDYLERMRVFSNLTPESRAAKLTLTSFSSRMENYTAPALAPPNTEEFVNPTPVEEMPPEKKRLWTRAGELQAKQELAEKDSSVVFSQSDKEELAELIRIL